MSIFEKAVEELLKIEGGYSDHASDKGGATNFGITQSVLESCRGRTLTKEDVKNLTIDEAKAIYKKLYWNTLRLDELHSDKIKCVLFDQAVNRGVSGTAKTLQKFLKITQDGVIGPKTIEAVNNLNEKEVILGIIKLSQIAYIRIVESNPTQIVFLEGWINRTHALLKYV